MRHKWMMVLLLVTSPAIFSSQATAEKRAFTIDDLYAIKSVADPTFSPDGRRIAFTVTQHDLKKGESNSDIHVMNADGSQLRKLTASDKSDFHPRWSPDGRSLLFLSTREGSAQAWRIAVDGGEAEQVTDFSTGCSEPVWSSDGGRVFFFSLLWPECGADSEANKKLADDMKKGPVRAHLADDLLYRHWDFWKDGKYFHTLCYDLKTEKYTDLTPGEHDAPYYMTGGNAGFSVAPDGREICVSSNLDPNHWETTNKDLLLIPADGGEPVNVTGANEAFDGNPRYSPDGRWIAYLRHEIPTFESDRSRLALFDRRSRKTSVLTEAEDLSISSFRWSPDAKSIIFKADHEGATPLYRLDVESKEVVELVDLRAIDAFDIAPDGRSIVLSRRSVGEPSEIWSVAIDGSGAKRLTFFNRPVEEQVDIRPAEQLWIDSPSGRKIHTFLVKPHDFDPSKKYPLILNVHGGPQGQWSDSFRGDWQVYPGAGYIVAFPNPHGSTGYGQEFTHAISRDWGGKVYADVMAVADHLAELDFVDKNRMGAMGWSYGGYMMMWLEGHTNRFKTLAAMMGVYDLPAMHGSTEELWFPQYDLGGTPWSSADYDRWSPHRYAHNFRTPCLVIAGEQDYRVSYTQSLEFFTALRQRDVPARLIVLANDGHWPNWVKSMPLYYAAHLDWFHRYLGGEPSPYDVEQLIRNRVFEEEE